jgi:hypothetical protein
VIDVGWASSKQGGNKRIQHFGWKSSQTKNVWKTLAEIKDVIKHRI